MQLSMSCSITLLQHSNFSLIITN